MPVGGFDEFKNELDRLEQNAKELDNRDRISFEELFNPRFMRQYTDFESIDEMFEESQWKIETPQDFREIPTYELDQYVRQVTEFSSFEQMKESATQMWIRVQLIDK